MTNPRLWRLEQTTFVLICLIWISRSAKGFNLFGHKRSLMNVHEGDGGEELVEDTRPEVVQTTWTDYGLWGPCSRTCGSGIQIRTRSCFHRFSHEYLSDNDCDGDPRQIQICKIQETFGVWTIAGPGNHYIISSSPEDCPVGIPSDYREEECSLLSTPQVMWKPLYLREDPALNPCWLGCYSNQAVSWKIVAHEVPDGTPCVTRSEKGVCITNECKTFGCDGLVGSTKVKDVCGVCDGNGNSCEVVSSSKIVNHLQVGYNEALDIPVGAINIRVLEVRGGTNYLALRQSDGRFVINGNYRIDNSRLFVASGSLCGYQRRNSAADTTGMSHTEMLTCTGPVNESLIVMVLTRDRSPSYLAYEYALPLEQYQVTTLSADTLQTTQMTLPRVIDGSREERNVTAGGHLPHANYSRSSEMGNLPSETEPGLTTEKKRQEDSNRVASEVSDEDDLSDLNTNSGSIDSSGMLLRNDTDRETSTSDPYKSQLSPSPPLDDLVPESRNGEEPNADDTTKSSEETSVLKNPRASMSTTAGFDIFDQEQGVTVNVQTITEAENAKFTEQPRTQRASSSKFVHFNDKNQLEDFSQSPPQEVDALSTIANELDTTLLSSKIQFVNTPANDRGPFKSENSSPIVTTVSEHQDTFVSDHEKSEPEKNLITGMMSSSRERLSEISSTGTSLLDGNELRGVSLDTDSDQGVTDSPTELGPIGSSTRFPTVVPTTKVLKTVTEAPISENKFGDARSHLNDVVRSGAGEIVPSIETSDEMQVNMTESGSNKSSIFHPTLPGITEGMASQEKTSKTLDDIVPTGHSLVTIVDAPLDTTQLQVTRSTMINRPESEPTTSLENDSLPREFTTETGSGVTVSLNESPAEDLESQSNSVSFEWLSPTYDYDTSETESKFTNSQSDRDDIDGMVHLTPPTKGDPAVTDEVLESGWEDIGEPSTKESGKGKTQTESDASEKDVEKDDNTDFGPKLIFTTDESPIFEQAKDGKQFQPTEENKIEEGRDVMADESKNNQTGIPQLRFESRREEVIDPPVTLGVAIEELLNPLYLNLSINNEISSQTGNTSWGRLDDNLLDQNQIPEFAVPKQHPGPEILSGIDGGLREMTTREPSQRKLTTSQLPFMSTTQKGASNLDNVSVTTSEPSRLTLEKTNIGSTVAPSMKGTDQPSTTQQPLRELSNLRNVSVVTSGQWDLYSEESNMSSTVAPKVNETDTLSMPRGEASKSRNASVITSEPSDPSFGESNMGSTNVPSVKATDKPSGNDPGDSRINVTEILESTTEQKHGVDMLELVSTTWREDIAVADDADSTDMHIDNGPQNVYTTAKASGDAEQKITTLSAATPSVPHNTVPTVTLPTNQDLLVSMPQSTLAPSESVSLSTVAPKIFRTTGATTVQTKEASTVNTTTEPPATRTIVSTQPIATTTFVATTTPVVKSVPASMKMSVTRAAPVSFVATTLSHSMTTTAEVIIPASVTTTKHVTITTHDVTTGSVATETPVARTTLVAATTPAATTPAAATPTAATPVTTTPPVTTTTLAATSTHVATTTPVGKTTHVAKTIPIAETTPVAIPALNATTVPVGATTALPTTEGNAISEITVRPDFVWRRTATSCQVTCGRGIQRDYVYCVNRDDVEVAERFCHPQEKPDPIPRSCFGQRCEARWEVGAWSSCTVTCGGGQQFRTVSCWQMEAKGMDALIMPGHCVAASGRELPDVQECATQPCFARWRTGQWSLCSAECGDGERTREVACSMSEGDRCDPTTKPSATEPCTGTRCQSNWATSAWPQCHGGCQTQARRVNCYSPSGSIHADSNCYHRRMPLSVRLCGSRECPPRWVAQAWNSDNCGDCQTGYRSREVFCQVTQNGRTELVSEDQCSHLQKPVPRSACYGQCGQTLPRWYTTRWSACSVSCGGGHKRRKVRCYESTRTNAASDMCDNSFKPPAMTACNATPCPAARPNCVDRLMRDQCLSAKRARYCTYSYYRQNCCRTCRG